MTIEKGPISDDDGPIVLIEDKFFRQSLGDRVDHVIVDGTIEIWDTFLNNQN